MTKILRGNLRPVGLTLLEVMIAMSILTVGVLSFIGAFGGITKSLHYSRGKTLATNLAQEKIESLKNLSYYRLLVTTTSVTASEPGLGGFSYDTGYYPPETLNVGQMLFQRRVLVQKVSESSGSITANNWYDNDTDLKLITSYVIWQDGSNWKKVTVTNLRDNPNRKKMDATFSGNVMSGAANLQNVKVFTLQDLTYSALTDSGGNYSFKVPSGDYDLKAFIRGYFPAVINSTVTSGATQTVNFNLTKMGYGSVQGTAFLQTHLVLAQICAQASDTDDNLEYVEIYNPTSQPFTMASNPNTPSYLIQYMPLSGSPVTTINPAGTTRYVNTVIPSHKFFLIASSAVVNGMTADAYYSDAGLVNNVPANRIPSGVTQSGGINMVSQGIYESSGAVVDAIGWGKTGGGPWGPMAAREGNGLQLSGANDGLSAHETLERIALSSATHLTMDPGGAHVTQGNAYDTNHNETDWVDHNHTGTDTPNNSSVTENPVSGTPAAGAVAFLDDGLSASAVALGVPVVGSFTITNVATGTWSIVVSSGGWMYSSTGTVIVTNGAQTNLGSIFISTTATYGYATGRVVDGGASPINGILVQAAGIGDTTDTNGYYRLKLDVGTYTVVANPNNTNALYTVGQATGVSVNLGQLTPVGDTTIFQGGSFKGFVTANGTDPLPGIPVIASNTATAVVVGSAVSDSLGKFSFPNIPLASYTLVPQLEVAESASPATLSGTVVAGSTVFVGTFTVTNAFGVLNGSVTASGLPITTGVLIIALAQPTTIGANPPSNDQTLRNGAVVYYYGSSQADGTYSLRMRGGSTYNVYAWYTSFSGTTPSTTQKTGTVTMAAGGTSMLNFSW